MRALFDNPRRDLLPGMYVRVRLEQAINRDAYLVPRDALASAPARMCLWPARTVNLARPRDGRATYRGRTGSSPMA